MLVLVARELAPLAPAGAAAVSDVLIGLTVPHGSWLTGQLMDGDYALDRLRPGYFLPTVAAGLLAGTAAAQVGQHDLGWVLFGYGAARATSMATTGWRCSSWTTPTGSG